MAVTWLADVLRAAGLTVVEHPNWRTRAVAGSWSPTYGVVHATAGPRTQSDETQVRLVRDGHSTLAGPIANACIDRQGRWHVLAAGRCNSTLVGTAGPFKGLGNPNALSTEACNDNISEPWPAVQYNAYVTGWAAWCRRLGWSASRLVGHKEHTPGRKSDPTFSMGTFRTDVARAIAGTPQTGKDGMETFSINDGTHAAGVWYEPLGVHAMALNGSQFERWQRDSGKPTISITRAEYDSGRVGVPMAAVVALLKGGVSSAPGGLVPHVHSLDAPGANTGPAVTD